MAHTDRDIRRIELRRHWSSDECTPYRWNCLTCSSLGKGWNWWDWPPPSSWHQECRREERASARHLMDRARAGHIDWDDLVIGYRRPYYW
jgi:hypothetical protein